MSPLSTDELINKADARGYLRGYSKGLREGGDVLGPVLDLWAGESALYLEVRRFKMPSKDGTAWMVMAERIRPGTKQAYDRYVGSGPTVAAAVADALRDEP